MRGKRRIKVSISQSINQPIRDVTVQRRLVILDIGYRMDTLANGERYLGGCWSIGQWKSIDMEARLSSFRIYCYFVFLFKNLEPVHAMLYIFEPSLPSSHSPET